MRETKILLLRGNYGLNDRLRQLGIGIGNGIMDMSFARGGLNFSIMLPENRQNAPPAVVQKCL